VKQKVKVLREKLNLNQNQLAEACSVSRQTIYAIESGMFKPSVLLALKIARELGTAVEEIFALEKGD
jgi:putative transcriptional regulator